MRRLPVQKLLALLLAISLLLGIAPSPRIVSAGRPRTLQQATFAAGCFWGVESAFRQVPGVVGTVVGYTGGRTAYPDYYQVAAGETGHVEAVQVTYDPSRVSYAELLDVFWSCHDPSLGLSPRDVGQVSQSVIFCADAQQESIARASLEEVQNSHIFNGPILTQIRTAQTFYLAEEEHQHYTERLGITESCHKGPLVVHTKLAGTAAHVRLTEPQ